MRFTARSTLFASVPLALGVVGACGGNVLWVGEDGASSTTTGAGGHTTSAVSTTGGFGGSLNGAATGAGGSGPACGGDETCTVNGSQCTCSGSCLGNKIEAICDSSGDAECECLING